MGSIFVRVEPTVRLVVDAASAELLRELDLIFDVWPDTSVSLEIRLCIPIRQRRLFDECVEYSLWI